MGLPFQPSQIIDSGISLDAAGRRCGSRGPVFTRAGWLVPGSAYMRSGAANRDGNQLTPAAVQSGRNAFEVARALGWVQR